MDMNMNSFHHRDRHGHGPSGLSRHGIGRRHGFGGRFGGPFGDPFDGGLSGGPGGPGGRRGQGGRRRLFSGDELKLILLNLISVEPRHGYDLIREIEALAGNAYTPSPGVVYPMLTLLTDIGHIGEQPGEGSRKLFAITPEGAAFLEENRDRLADAMERLDRLAKASARTDGAPIQRAMQNLAAAIRGRLGREGTGPDAVFDVAALIDEAAGKIERLK
jgi:DNA-binding PadR family transcriptional regulator